MAQLLAELTAARVAGVTPIPYDELPITQGLAGLIADCIADMDLYAIPADVAAAVQRGEIPAGEVGQHRLGSQLLDQPNPDEDRADTLAKLVQSIFWTGNAYGLTAVRPGSRSVWALNVLNPSLVAPKIDLYDDQAIVGWYVNGTERSRGAVAHWRWNVDPRHGPLGTSPLQRCRAALDVYGWAYWYLGDYFGSGGNPGSILKDTVRDLTDAESLQLVTDWINARRSRRPAVLPRSVEFDVPAASGEQAATLEVLAAASAEVARMLNVPPSLANAPTPGYSLTYANVGDEFRRWLALSLGPTWIARIERGFSALLPRSQRAHLDPSGLFRPELFAGAGGRPVASRDPAPSAGAGALPPAPAPASTDEVPA